MNASPVTNICIDYSTRDLAEGIPVSELPPELQRLDVNGDGFIKGLEEAWLLREVVEHFRENPNSFDGPSQEAFLSLQELVPEIHVTGVQGQILYGGESVAIRGISEVPLDRRELDQIAGAILLFSPGLWADLVRTVRPMFLLGTSEELGNFFARSNSPENRHRAAHFKGSGFHAALTFRSPDRPGVSFDVAIAREAVTGLTALRDGSGFGCPAPFHFNTLFHRSLHEIGHLMDRGLSFKRGIPRKLTDDPSSLVPSVIRTQQQREGRERRKDDAQELFAEAVVRFGLCRMARDLDTIPPTARLPATGRTETLYSFPHLDEDLWQPFVESFSQFFSTRELDPNAFI